ncbi:MAG: sodium:calcium antiporter [Desulfobacteraceae bacterium]|nr:sodium:calcium antiporter [Desulfobacteraceae bacterium]
MKKFSVMLMVMFVVCCFAGIGMASEGTAKPDTKANKDECMLKVKEAVELIKKVGVEAAFKQINDKKGTFVWKDTYVFCMDTEDAKILAHPTYPRIIGWKMKETMDADGKKFFLEMLELAKTKGEGWVNYMHVKPGDQNPSPKSSYVMKVPDQKIIVGAGVYE